MAHKSSGCGREIKVIVTQSRIFGLEVIKFQEIVSWSRWNGQRVQWLEAGGNVWRNVMSYLADIIDGLINLQCDHSDALLILSYIRFLFVIILRSEIVRPGFTKVGLTRFGPAESVASFSDN